MDGRIHQWDATYTRELVILDVLLRPYWFIQEGETLLLLSDISLIYRIGAKV